VSSDLGYLEAWSVAATGAPLVWPPSDEEAVRFVAHHLFVPTTEQKDQNNGMPGFVEEVLREEEILQGSLPHAPSTVRRRLASWRRVAAAKGFDDALTSFQLRQVVSAAAKASERPVERNSKKAVTKEVLDQILGERTDHPGKRLSFRELRDRTILLVAFATGGRRRSEIGALRLENVFQLDGGKRYGIHLGRTKTVKAQDGEHLIVRGRSASSLEGWLEAFATMAKRNHKRTNAREATAPKPKGPLFPSIDRWNNISARGISGASVNAIVKRKAEAAGIKLEGMSAHGLRSGYLTEASRQGVQIEEAMRHSCHRSVNSAARYYDNEKLEDGKAARLGG
jgi:integrase